MKEIEKLIVDFTANNHTFKEAWNACPRGEWMLKIAATLKVDDKKLTLAKGLCAQTIIHLMQDIRSVKAVHAAIAYGRGEIDKDSIDAVITSASAASHAAYVRFRDHSFAASHTHARAHACATTDDHHAAIRITDLTDAITRSANAAASHAAAAAIYAVISNDAFGASYVAINTASAAGAAAVAADTFAFNAYDSTAYARIKNEKETADICREVLTDGVMKVIDLRNTQKRLKDEQ